MVFLMISGFPGTRTTLNPLTPPPVNFKLDKVDTSSNRVVDMDSVTIIRPCLTNLVSTFEGLYPHLDVKLVWFIRKSEDGDGFQTWHKDLVNNAKTDVTIVINIGSYISYDNAEDDGNASFGDSRGNLNDGISATEEEEEDFAMSKKSKEGSSNVPTGVDDEGDGNVSSGDGQADLNVDLAELNDETAATEVGKADFATSKKRKDRSSNVPTGGDDDNQHDTLTGKKKRNTGSTRSNKSQKKSPTKQSTRANDGNRFVPPGSTGSVNNANEDVQASGKVRGSPDQTKDGNSQKSKVKGNRDQGEVGNSKKRGLEQPKSTKAAGHKRQKTSAKDNIKTNKKASPTFTPKPFQNGIPGHLNNA